MLAHAGIGAFKKATEGATPTYAVFCDTKLKELNEGVYSITIPLHLTKSMLLGKEVGEKMTLRDLLITESGTLRTQFKALSHDERDMLLNDYLQAKENKENVPKRVSQAAIAKAVYSQMQLVSTTVSVHITSLTCF